MRGRILAGWPLLAAVLLILGSGICLAEDHGEGEEGIYKVALAFDHDGPVLGTNRVTITVTDSDNRPVTGKRVKVSYFMPSLRGKPPMMGRSTMAKASGNVYEATLKLTMKGEWRVIVSVGRAERTDDVAFAYDVR